VVTLDKNTETQNETNLDLLNCSIRRYSSDFQPEYEKFIHRTTRIEYSKGGVTNTFGFYSFELYSELVITNYNKGKLYKREISCYDYKYFFENNQLIMIEKFFDGVIANTFLMYSNEQDLVLIDYNNTKSDTSIKSLHSVVICQYNDGHKLSKYLHGLVLKDHTFYYYESQEYAYTQTEMKITRTLYQYQMGAKKMKEETFPISVLEKKKNVKNKQISDQMIKKILKNNWMSIMKSWNIHDGYAITLIMHDRMTIEIDYAEENANNQDPYSQERWDYTYWEQNSFPLLKSEEEKNLFSAWLDQLDDKGISTESLIENTVFTSMVVTIVNEIKADRIIEKSFGRSVPVICTNFDISDEMLELNRKVNIKEQVRGYLFWVESL
jgi:hypothetical protein